MPTVAIPVPGLSLGAVAAAVAQWVSLLVLSGSTALTPGPTRSLAGARQAKWQTSFLAVASSF